MKRLYGHWNDHAAEIQPPMLAGYHHLSVWLLDRHITASSPPRLRRRQSDRLAALRFLTLNEQFAEQIGCGPVITICPSGFWIAISPPVAHHDSVGGKATDLPLCDSSP